MSETKFTPGPWKFINNCGWTIRFEAHSGSLMGNATSYPWVPTNKADWHLIASAPELYEALETCLLYGEMTGDEWVTAKAEAALEKARGEG